METIDLHGIRHEKVQLLVENFVLLNDLPVRIITGNSPVMKSLVNQVLAKHSLKAEPEHHWNLGSLIVTAI